MNYLSRISELDGDDYKVHQTLKGIFDQDKILFQRGRFETAILSRKAPVNHSPSVMTKDISAFLNTITIESEFLFTVRLNPVITRKVGEKSKRLPVESKNLREWLRRKFVESGILAEYVYEIEGPRFSRKKEHLITHSSVFVTGMCRVEDVVCFKNSLVTGIGHSKGFGFGMLNIYANL